MRAPWLLASLLLLGAIAACSGSESEDSAPLTSRPEDGSEPTPTDEPSTDPTAAPASEPTTAETEPTAVSATEPATVELGEGPCALASATEVSDVTGQVMQDGEASQEGAVDICEWLSTEESANENISSPMKITMSVGALEPEAAEAFDEYDAPGVGVKVDGLGDRAVLVCGISADIGPGCDTYEALIAPPRRPLPRCRDVELRVAG